MKIYPNNQYVPALFCRPFVDNREDICDDDRNISQDDLNLWEDYKDAVTEEINKEIIRIIREANGS